ncbi:MAG: ABC transporter permease [bacterium]
MFKSYLKIAVRNLLTHKGYSFINIAGLAIGMACCMLILLYVQYELSFDNYHERSTGIYRLSREWFNSDGSSSLHLGHVAPPIAPLLKSEYPDIEQAVRLTGWGNPLINYGDKYFQEERFFFADPEIFQVFTLPFARGDAETALRDPNNVVITVSIADKYFGEADPLNKVLTFEIPGLLKTDFKVTGVMQDMPGNSHFHLDFVGSMKALELAFGDDEFQSWGSNNYATYLLLPQDLPPEEVEAHFPAFLDKHLTARNIQRTGQPPTRPPSERNKLHLWPLRTIHLHSQLDSEIEANGNIIYVYIFSLTAFFVLLIACINFMNLATARSANRMKEVGLRKVVGADRKRLIVQFLGESVFMALVSLVVAVLLVEAALPRFSEFVGLQFVLDVENNFRVLLALLSIALFVGLTAGSYPAFYLSRFQPVHVLKTAVSGGSSKSVLRKTLVIFQFAISIILIISMGVVYNQLEYCNKKNLGLNKEHIIVLPISQQMRGMFASIKSQLLQHPLIVSVAGSKRVPSGRLLDSSGARLVAGDRTEPLNFRLANVRIDHNFLETYGIELAAGRDFSVRFATDSTEAFILNETAVQKIGWSSAHEAVGQPFEYGGRRGKIIGVVKDFHYESLHQPITPIVMVLWPRRFNQISIKIRPQEPDDIQNVLSFLQTRWQQYLPNQPFNASFVDERYADLYQNEHKLGQIFILFSVLAVSVACLGLFGLASFMAEQRHKEIGIRKVLGATVPNVALLLTREFVLLVGLATVVAWFVSFYAMQEWLLRFAYRIDIHGQAATFVLASLLALLIAVATVSYQAIRTAMANPVEALRCE